jgi:hypothetical protein
MKGGKRFRKPESELDPKVSRFDPTVKLVRRREVQGDREDEGSERPSSDLQRASRLGHSVLPRAIQMTSASGTELQPGRPLGRARRLGHGSRDVVQRYWEGSYLGGLGGTYKHADDLSVAVDSNHGLWASAGKALTANNALQTAGSNIRLNETNESATFYEGTRFWKTKQATLKKIEAKNTRDNSSRDTMNLYADCGRANSEVVGSSNRHAVYKDPSSGTTSQAHGGGLNFHYLGMDFAGGSPDGMKIQIMHEYMKSEYSKSTTSLSQKSQIDDLYNAANPKFQALGQYVQDYNNGTHTDLDGYWPLLAELAEIFMGFYNNYPHDLQRDTIDQQLGINKYANPSVGQGYTTSTGGAVVQGHDDDTWTFHWGGVIMESTDGADKVVLENYSVSDWNAENSDWVFEMYGTQKKGQSFHERHKGTGQHGQSPTTMTVEKD